MNKSSLLGRSRFVAFTAIVIACWTSTISSAANFEIRPSNFGAGFADLYLTGVIEAHDHEQFLAIVRAENSAGRVVTSLRLNSPGGSVQAAIEIGEEVRRLKIGTLAPEKGKIDEVCASACALVWLAGPYRIGVVLAHRSYLRTNDGEMGFSKYSEALNRSHEEIRKYVSMLELPSTVSDKILATPSSQVIPLSAPVDAPNFDLVLEEYILARCDSNLDASQQSIRELLSEWGGENQEDAIYALAYRLLEEKRVKWRDCARLVLLEIQRESQIR